MLRYFRLHLLLFLLLHLPPPSLQQQQQQDPSAANDDVRLLLEFKKGIRSDPSGMVFGTWTQPDPSSSAAAAGGGCPRYWYGITCDDYAGGGGVVAVSLQGLALSGEIKFSTLIGMRSLQKLDLSKNNLTGRLPPGLGSVVSLQHLDLSLNQFYGPIPDRITDLWALSYLNLSHNNFQGGFPRGIWKMQQLRKLDLRSNRQWGDVRAVLSELRNAELVDLSGNAFYGQLSMPAENLSSLANTVRYLNLSHNRLGGQFFSKESMLLLTNLEVLDVSHNALGGELPAFSSLTNLKVLRASSNQFYGKLPEELFGSSIPLTELDLSENGFTGSIIDSNSTSLQILNLSSNALSGSLPSKIGSCAVMDFSENMLSGDLSAFDKWGVMLKVVDLSSNSLSGTFPNLTSPLEDLSYLKIRNNSLQGGLPSVLGASRSLSTIDFSLNKLEGPLLPSLFTLFNLTYLNLSGNHFTGAIPIQKPLASESLLLSASLHMESLDLSDNSLSGSISADIVSMQKLKLLDLHTNSLSGEIPAEIGELNSLEYLDLSSNRFRGKIPDMPQASLSTFNVSYNDLSGLVPESVRRFSDDCFHPGNALLIFSDRLTATYNYSGVIDNAEHRHLKSRIGIIVSVGSVGAVILIFFICMAAYRIRSQELCGRKGSRGQASGRDLKLSRYAPSIFRPHKNEPVSSSMSFSNHHLLNSAHGSVSAHKELVTNTGEREFSDLADVGEADQQTMKLGSPGENKSCPGSPLATSPHCFDQNISEQPVVLDVYSPERLAGELVLLDNSLLFTAENLSRAPAEILGRSNHGTSYKATLDNGHALTVKWLRAGLVKRRKEFAKEVKKISAIRHPNIISLRGYFWGPREQERLILSDFVNGDSLVLHLYESTPRRYPKLTLNQRLNIAIDVARSLCFLHLDVGLPHGNLKPANVLLSGPHLTAQLTDYGLHRLMTSGGICEQTLNLGALGYRAPELVAVTKPYPSFKADVYAFGVILMELLTRRGAGDIISGQSGAVDLTDWVRMCAREGRGMECYDRDIAESEEAPRAMDELLDISLKCILPVDERPNIKTVFDDLCSIIV